MIKQKGEDKHIILKVRESISFSQHLEFHAANKKHQKSKAGTRYLVASIFTWSNDPLNVTCHDKKQFCSQ